MKTEITALVVNTIVITDDEENPQVHINSNDNNDDGGGGGGEPDLCHPCHYGLLCHKVKVIQSLLSNM